VYLVSWLEYVMLGGFYDLEDGEFDGGGGVFRRRGP
jgi:hypothetical protein